MSTHRSLFRAAAPAKAASSPVARNVLAAAVTLAAAGAAHAQVTGNPTRGAQLWANPGAGLPACETCHSTATPPVVTGFPSLATMRNSLGAMTTANAKQKTIAAIAGTPLMAAYRGSVSNGTALSDTDLNDLAAYIFPPSATPAPAPAPAPAPTPTPAPAPAPTPAPPPGAPVVSATPSIIGFPSTTVGAVSARQEIVVTNGTSAAVQFAANAVMLMPIPGTNPPQAPAGATDFQLATAAAGTAATCQNNGVLQPGATCRIGVLFRPTGTAGFRSATWSVSFANATAQQVTLSGTATAPAPAPSPTPTPSPAPAASGTSSSRSGASNVGAGGGAVDPLGLLLGGALLTAAAGLRRRK